MKSAEHLDRIEKYSKGLVNLCINFANEKTLEQSDTRLFRLYAAYVVAVDALTQGVKSSSGQFMDELKQERDKRTANL